MKSYGLRNGVAQFLNMPRERVRVVYMDGPQVYGRTAADDVGFEAAFLARELGRPVRVQWMRHEETAWDTKGPAYTFKLRGGLDESGKLTALDGKTPLANVVVELVQPGGAETDSRNTQTEAAPSSNPQSAMASPARTNPQSGQSLLTSAATNRVLKLDGTNSYVELPIGAFPGGRSPPSRRGST